MKQEKTKWGGQEYCILQRREIRKVRSISKNMYILVQNKFKFALNSVFCVLELANKDFVHVYGLCGGSCGGSMDGSDGSIKKTAYR